MEILSTSQTSSWAPPRMESIFPWTGVDGWLQVTVIEIVVSDLSQAALQKTLSIAMCCLSPLVGLCTTDM